MKSIISTLERLGIEPRRIQVAEVPQGNTKKFTDTANSFIEEIRTLGPLF